MELHWSRELDPRGNVPKVVDENLLITVSVPFVVSAKEPSQLPQLFPNPKIRFPPEFELHSFLTNDWIRNEKKLYVWRTFVLLYLFAEMPLKT